MSITKVTQCFWDWNFSAVWLIKCRSYCKNFRNFHAAEKFWKTIYTATARILIYLYQTNHDSKGAKKNSKSCHTYKDSTVNFSDFIEQYKEHEK